MHFVRAAEQDAVVIAVDNELRGRRLSQQWTQDPRNFVGRFVLAVVGRELKRMLLAIKQRRTRQYQREDRQNRGPYYHDVLYVENEECAVATNAASLDTSKRRRGSVAKE